MLGEFCELCDGGIKRKANKRAQPLATDTDARVTHRRACVCVRCTLGQLVKLRVENALRDGDAAHGLIAFRHGGQQRLVQPARELRGLVDAVLHLILDLIARFAGGPAAQGFWTDFSERQLQRGVPFGCPHVFEIEEKEVSPQNKSSKFGDPPQALALLAVGNADDCPPRCALCARRLDAL